MMAEMTSNPIAKKNTPPQTPPAEKNTQEAAKLVESTTKMDSQVDAAKNFYDSFKAQERVENMALPNDIFMVFDMPAHLEYHFVPVAIKGNALSHHPFRSHAETGWRRVEAEYMARRPGKGLPWMHEYEERDGYVCLDEHWLMVKNVDLYEERRRQNVALKNEALAKREEPGEVETPHSFGKMAKRELKTGKEVVYDFIGEEGAEE